MKINMKFGMGVMLTAMLLVSMAFVPAVSAAENNMEANSSEIPNFDSWTKPQDLSRFDGYKPQIKKVPLSKEEFERLYPGTIALNTSEKKELGNILKEDSSLTEVSFSPDGTVSVKKSHDITNEPEKIMLATENQIQMVVKTWKQVISTISPLAKDTE